MEEVRWDHTTIGILAQGLEPRDWTQLELLTRLTSGQQILAGMRAQTFAMAALRGTLRRRFPPTLPGRIEHESPGLCCWSSR